MNTNNQNKPNDTDTTTALELFATLNGPAQDAFMSVLRLADAIRADVLPGDSRAPMMELFDSAFDGAAAA